MVHSLVGPFAALVAVVAAAAQAPSMFADLHLPAGVPAVVGSLGKLVHLFDGAAVQVFSACTRRWHALPCSPTATTHQTNDIVLVREASVWTGFAASRGRFAALPVSPGAVLVNALSRNNDSVLLVRDGAALHAFSGFTGHWVTRSVSALAAVDVQRHTALLADGPLLAGFDAFSGQWHDLVVAEPVTLLSADGVCGVAATASTLYGFASARGAWAAAPAPANATFHRDDDWAVFHDGVAALGFAGPTGTFAGVVTGPVTSQRGEDLFALLATAGDTFAFSAVTGTWSQCTHGPAATVVGDVATALVVDAQQVAAYSAPRGMFTVLPLASHGEVVAGSVAAVVDGAQAPYLYSALTGAWSAAPANALPGLPALTTTAALLATDSGYLAYSVRRGSFTALTTAAGVGVANQQSAPLVVYDDQANYFFDARTDRWLASPRAAAGAPNVQVWRTSVLILDGNELVAFGSQSAAIDRRTLSEPVVGFRVNSEGASVRTATHVIGVGAVPQPTSLSQFPDFRRVLTLGAPFGLHLRLLPGELALLGYGAPMAPQPLLDLGELAVDPATLIVSTLLPEPDADRAVFQVAVPHDAALRGARFALQALVAPVVGTPYLTDVAEACIY